EIVPDGLAMRPTLERVAASGAFPVIPWGFGKWWLRRGELVRRQLTLFAPQSLALGDNGGRLANAPRPTLFQRAEQQGFAVLPGTDPFPFPGQEARVGSYGFVLENWHRSDQPVEELLQRLRALSGTPRCFGRLTNPLRFAISQVRMQVRMRTPAKQIAP
ncbi:MAG TPA: hypothetical protein VNZ06_03365, partial [Steroidobacteraceae bacterium]|nr:hypothetical protein [Steroidobacteraceae bacterium]